MLLYIFISVKVELNCIYEQHVFMSIVMLVMRVVNFKFYSLIVNCMHVARTIWHL